MTTDAVRLEAECQRLSEELSELSRRLENLEHEREFLILHTRNLEREMQRLARDKTELETMLRDSIETHRAVVSSRSWHLMCTVLAPYRAVRRGLRRLSGTVTESPVIPRE